MIDLALAQQLLQADGGDIELVAVEGGTVHLRLLLGDAECAECVLPRPLLEQVVLDIVQRTNPDVTAVHIDDPREQP